MSDTLRRELQTEVRVLDGAKGLCQYVASDQTVDHAREVILARGWRFTHFSRNAPFVDSHNYGSIERVLGRVTDYRVEGGKLVETVQWAIDVPGHDAAQLGWKLTQGGYLRACSVGFVPTKWVGPIDRDRAEYEQLCGELAIERDRRPYRIYTEQEQIELSACVIGCNPNALMRGYRDGVLSEEDMVRAGISGDEEYAFLQRAAAEYDRADGSVQALVRSALATMFRARPSAHPQTKDLQERTPPHHTALDADMPAGAEGAYARREWGDFIGVFRTLGY